jgi:hypothetical protein
VLQLFAVSKKEPEVCLFHWEQLRLRSFESLQKILYKLVIIGLDKWQIQLHNPANPPADRLSLMSPKTVRFIATALQLIGVLVMLTLLFR